MWVRFFQFGLQLRHTLPRQGTLRILLACSDKRSFRIVEVKRCVEEITSIANPNLVQEVLVPLLVSTGSDAPSGTERQEIGQHFLLPPGYPFTNASVGEYSMT